MNMESVLSDDEFDIVSNPGQRSLESSIADLDHVPKQEVHEPTPTQAALDQFDTVRFTAADIQAYVRKSLDSATGKNTAYPLEQRTVRVYVDGVFDMFNPAHALQLRQAKLAFPSVYLTVGIFSDDLCNTYQKSSPLRIPHAERCEVVRHCRWVDEIISDAPWTVDDQFILDRKFDYMALDEGMSVNPECDKFRLKGYDALKKIGRIIPTRRTAGVSVLKIPTTPLAPPTALVVDNTPFLKDATLPEDPEQEEVHQYIDKYGIGFG